MEGVKVTDDDPLKESPTIFGREIRSIPCFRDSFFYGFFGAAVGGLVSFLATSKARFSTHMAFASFWVTTFGYWFPCRYKYENQYAKFEQWKKSAKQGIPIKLDLNNDKEEETKENTGV